MLVRLIAFLCLPLVLLGCLSMQSSDGKHRIQRLLEGRKVVYDMPESTAEWKRPASMVPEYQTWAADGTTVLHWRPLLVHYKTYPKKGRWWIKGDQYCVWYNPEDPPQDLDCYTVKTEDDGARIMFRENGDHWLFRDVRHGSFVPN
jgi:hypothetical protein